MVFVEYLDAMEREEIVPAVASLFRMEAQKN